MAMNPQMVNKLRDICDGTYFSNHPALQHTIQTNK